MPDTGDWPFWKGKGQWWLRCLRGSKGTKGKRPRSLGSKREETKSNQENDEGTEAENCFVPKGCSVARSGWQEGTVKAAMTTGGRGKSGAIIKWIFRCISEN